jgi:hypothetical protein
VQCPLCGIEYDLSHKCYGVASDPAPEEAWPNTGGFGFAPGHYVRMGFEIALLKGVAIRRAACDPNAIAYGAVFCAISAATIFLMSALPSMLRRPAASLETIALGILLGFIFSWVYLGLIVVGQLSLCHILAKVVFDGKGTLLGVMRPSLLAGFVSCLVLIPDLGVFAVAAAWSAIVGRVLQKVNRLPRLPAYLIPGVINFLFFGLTYHVSKSGLR